MAKKKARGPETYLWRGGKKLRYGKVSDRFTARLKRGVAPGEVEASYGTSHRRRLARQDLDEFSVVESRRDSTMKKLRKGNEIEFASHVYALEDGSPFYLTDEITIQFRPEVTDGEITALASDLGLSLVKGLPDPPRTYVFRATAQAIENPLKIADRLLARDEVLACEPNIVIESQSFHTPADPLFPEQWHLDHDGGPFLAPGSHVDARRAWAITRGERSVVVAIADDSVDLYHSDLQGEGKIVAPRDFAGSDFEPQPETASDNHGTACAGVAVAEENEAGVVGVAPGCALMPIRTTGHLDDQSIEDLFDWVIENGASVLSCSWGPAARHFPLSLRQSGAIHRAAIAGRNGLGCVILFAAGNANRPVDGVVDEKGWPGGRPSGPTPWLGGFAAHEDVIAVSATTSLGRKAAYSNWGKEISIAAPSSNGHPGSGRRPTYPIVSEPMPGRGIVTTDRIGPAGYSTSDYTFDFGGTSSACPTAAGVAALVLSANPRLTAREVREILEITADRIIDPHPDPQLGLEHGSYDENGHSLWFGHGKVNALAAVTEAMSRRTVDPVESIKKDSAPALAIPDHDPSGIKDTIHLDEGAIISNVKVDVDITHSFIGDLRVILLSPAGTAVVLHEREGGGRRDLKETFDLATIPGLSALFGEIAQGDWDLLVQDLAPIDSGFLNRWELEIDVRSDAVVMLEEAPGAAIPDNDPNGIERALSTDRAGHLREIAVELDITHAFIGDLMVILVSPSGTAVPLHERTGGSADNLIRTYSVENTPALQALSGEAIEGTWRLKVADEEGLDTGKLNRWALSIAAAP